MRLLSILFITGAVLIITAIKTGDSSNETVTPGDSGTTDFRIDITNPANLSIKDMWDKIELVPLETTEECMISSLTDVVYRDNIYYVLDEQQSSLFLFSDDGKYINKIQRQGRGPGEYMMLYDFEINPFTGNIELLNPRGEILVYDRDCNFIEKTSIPLRASHFFTNLSPEEVILYSIYEDKKIHYLVRGCDSIYKSEYSFLDYIAGTQIISGKRSPFYRNGDEVYFLDAVYYSIKRFNENQLENEYYLDFNGKNIDFNKLPKDKELFYYVNYFRTGDKPYDLQNFVINDSLMILRCIYKGDWHTVMINRKSYEIKVIKKFKEDVVFPGIFDFCDEGIYSIVEPIHIELLVNPGILDDANSLKLKKVDMNSNPVIIKYHFKEQD
jgi:hypothetical protein